MNSPRRSAWSTLFVTVVVVLTLVGVPAGAATTSVGCPAGSLQAAIDGAAPGDTITFTGTCSENLVIGKNLTITGSGTAVIDGSGNEAQTVVVQGGANVVVSGVTVAGGNGMAIGGGFYVGAGTTLTLSNSTVADNFAGFGAGLANFGTVTITGSEFTGNEADDDGGGIYSEGALSLTNVVFDSNFASNGGGVWIESGTGAVTGGTFSYNFAANLGGGLGTTRPFPISGSSFTDNLAGYGAGVFVSLTDQSAEQIGMTTFGGNFADISGGAIYSEGVLTVNGGIFTENSAVSGGGIWADGTATVTGSRFSGNQADDSGGGIINFGRLAVSDSVFVENGADYGGALHTAETGTLDVAIESSSLTANSATTSGGAIYAESALTVTNSTVSGNDAEFGGGILTAGPGDVTLRLSTVGANSAYTAGGGLRAESPGRASLVGVILAANTAPDGPDCSGAITSAGSNVIQSTAGCGISPSGTDTVGVDPLLNAASTAPNGTTVWIPKPSSPALNRVPTASCATAVDQRGFYRPQGGACDAGAVERPDSELALVDPATGQWYLRHWSGQVDTFFYGTPGDVPLMGDWNCDGVDTPGAYRQSNGFVYLRNSNTTGAGEVRFFLGNPGDIPLVGDFNGDGCDTVSVYRPSEGRVFISDLLGANDGFFTAQKDYYFGVPGDRPFAGDFDGDGKTSVGLYRESSGFVYFRNVLDTGVAEFQFFYGEPSDRILAGDWDGNGADTVGIFRPRDAKFFLSNANVQKTADLEFFLGQGTWIPVAGKAFMKSG